MQGGIPRTSPWFYDSGPDYQGNRLTITVPWDDSVGGNRNILNGTVVHRDPGCVYTNIVFDDPSKVAKKKPLPDVPEGDTTVTAQQVRQATGFRTIDDLLLVQVTAEAH